MRSQACLSFVHDPNLFCRPSTSQPLTQLSADLEPRFACLVVRHASRHVDGADCLDSIPERASAQPEPDEMAPEQALRLALEPLADGPREVLRGRLAGKSGVQIAKEMGRSCSWVSDQEKRGR